MFKYINGPINYAKLRGNINGVEKTVHLFMDKHYKLDEQTKCESYESIDIAHFLYKKIKKAKNPLDFFIEIRNEHIRMPRSNKRDIYLREAIDLFKSEFIREENKVRYSKSNKNVRLHFLDIRDFFDIFYILDIINYDWKIDFDLLLENKLEDSNKLFNHLDKIKKYLNKLETIKKDIESGINSNTRTSYYLNKIINKYQNEELKSNLQLFMNLEFTKNIFVIYSLLEEIREKIKRFNILDNSSKKNISKIIYYMSEFIIDLYSILTDIYFLRRVLDKDYITNIITYTGRQHAINYIYFLVKYCKFDLIYIYKHEETNMEKLKNKIMLLDKLRDAYKLFNILDNNLLHLQCLELPKSHYDLLR
jgi:hypothetical protein